jgi:class 3 adenylate cyclase
MALLIDYWRIRLQPADQRDPDWKESLQQSIDALGTVSEGEILTRLLLAEEQMAQGDHKGAVRQLDQAFTRAIESNHPGWQEQVGRVFHVIDSEQYSRRTIERFSGRPAEEMEKTTTEDATIIFADLANFTSRSTELSAEEVMETVRSVFELAVPLLAKHQVRPLQHLGDGLLAACQGDDHSRRGLQFAIDLVERTNAASRIRRAQGETWGLDLRAGVNSGPVVFGLLGSSYKQEWLAIGKTTNLAARLQSKGEIGEVVTLPEIAERVGHVGSNDTVEAHPMKGFDEPVPLLRIRV